MTSSDAIAEVMCCNMSSGCKSSTKVSLLEATYIGVTEPSPPLPAYPLAWWYPQCAIMHYTQRHAMFLARCTSLRLHAQLCTGTILDDSASSKQYTIHRRCLQGHGKMSVGMKCLDVRDNKRNHSSGGVWWTGLRILYGPKTDCDCAWWKTQCRQSGKCLSEV